MSKVNLQYSQTYIMNISQTDTKELSFITQIKDIDTALIIAKTIL